MKTDELHRFIDKTDIREMTEERRDWTDKLPRENETDRESSSSCKSDKSHVLRMIAYL